ncbi:MAG: TonB-dependent receptor [Bdellovibrionales bacterium]|nr:TonB-dependent receptor [Bdellovibrionales bacterium]
MLRRKNTPFPGLVTRALIACGLFFVGWPSALFALPNDRETLGDDCYRVLRTGEGTPALRSACLGKQELQPSLVITATRRPGGARSAPAALSIVRGDALECPVVDSIAEALRDVPGVEITDSGQAGLRRVRIRGEESRRVAVLIDGQEFIDEREVGTPLLIAPEMVERIEVLRGTGSVLHGSRAIGGIVNIITKKAGTRPAQGSASTLVDSATGGKEVFASAFGKHRDVGYRIAASHGDFGDRKTPAGTIDNTSFENDSLFAYLEKDLGKHKLALAYDSYQSSSDVFVEEDVRTSPPFVDFRIDAPRRDRRKTALFYDATGISPLLERLHVDAYYQTSKREFNTFSIIELHAGPPLRQTTSVFSDSTLDTLGTNVQMDLRLAAENILIVGLEATSDSLDQVRRREVVANGFPAPMERLADEAVQESLELFAQDEWQFAPDWKATAGVRGYWLDTTLEESTRVTEDLPGKTDRHLVGAAGVEYSGIRDTIVWAGWSQGFVYPSLINSATGAFAGPDFVHPNPELLAERSNGYEVGLRYDDGRLAMDTTFFLSAAKDYIDHVRCTEGSDLCGPRLGSRDRVYVNVDQARTYGAELAASFDAGAVTPYGSLTWLRRRFEGMDGTTYKTGLPSLSGRGGVRFDHRFSPDMRGWLDFYTRAATGSDELLDDGSVEHAGGWGTLNLSVGTALLGGEHLRYMIDFLNLGDKLYRTSTENLPARGRSVVFRVVGEL